MYCSENIWRRIKNENNQNLPQQYNTKYFSKEKKRDLTKILGEEIYNTPRRRNYPTNKTISIHINEKWSIDLADISDYKTSKNKKIRYIFIIIDNSSKVTRAIPIKNSSAQTKTIEFSNFLSTSKRPPVNFESDPDTKF